MQLWDTAGELSACSVPSQPGALIGGPLLLRRAVSVTRALPSSFSCSRWLRLIQCVPICHCAGQERFQALGMAYYRGADIVLFMYDITSRQSFVNVQAWMDEVGFLRCVIGCRSGCVAAVASV